MINTENIGLNLIEEFISEKEEKFIISNIGEPKKNINRSKLLRNSIKRYGSSLPYENDMVSAIIPKYLDDISQKIVDKGYLDIKPNSVSINEYLKGNAIAPHIDSLTSGEIISVLSLLSDATMVFHKNEDEFSIKLPRRSLVQIRDEIRYNWKHSVLPVSDTRYSIVFRLG
jgi:alkylated DNA repair dioxygenase AlkB